jgi:hypothetical protein
MHVFTFIALFAVLAVTHGRRYCPVSGDMVIRSPGAHTITKPDAAN